VSERVEELGLGVRWEPNAPDAVVCSDDLGRATLALVAHPDDDDQRSVILTWTGVLAVCATPHNDEARHLHPLDERGLRDLLWAGVVADSTWIGALAPAVHNASGTLHYVLPLKERTIEVAARDLAVSRSDLEPPKAAANAL
jgi:hypothetical protein